MLVIPYSLMDSAQIKKRHICLTLAEIKKRGLSEKLSKCHTVTLSHSDFVTPWRTVFCLFGKKKTSQTPPTKFSATLYNYNIVEKSFHAHSKTQFLTGCCQTFDVTQWRRPIWKTVQNHHFGYNFFIFKPRKIFRYVLESAWYLWCV